MKILDKKYFKLQYTSYTCRKATYMYYGKQGRDKKSQKYYPTTERWQSQQSELWMEVHYVGGQKGGRHHSVVE